MRNPKLVLYETIVRATSGAQLGEFEKARKHQRLRFFLFKCQALKEAQ